MEMPADKNPYTQEEEAEILAKFKASTQAEMSLIKSILKYMLLYKKALPLEQAGQTYPADFYLDKLHNLPDEMDLKRDAWIQALGEVVAFAKKRGLDLEQKFETERDELTFEKRIRQNIENLKRMIRYFYQQKGQLNHHPALIKKQITAFLKAIAGWEAILHLRKNLLKMGGKDFFELFDGTLQQCHVYH